MRSALYNIRVDVYAGEMISNVAYQLANVAYDSGADVTTTFNDIKLRATPTSSVDDIAHDYWTQHNARNKG